MHKLEHWINYDKETDKFTLDKKSALENVVTKTPLSIWWIITWKCNLNCLHCYGNEEELPTNETSADQAMQIAERIVSEWIHRLSISWWEPMLRKDLTDLVEYLSDNWVSVIVSTNGLAVKKKIAGLKKLRHIEFSLDWSWNNHELFRPSRTSNNNSFSNAKEWIKAAVDEWIKTRVLTTLTYFNKSDLKWIGELVDELWVEEWHIGQAVKAWRARHIHKQLMSGVDFTDDQLEELREKFPNVKVQYNYPSKTSNYYALILPDGVMYTQDTDTWDKVELWSVIDLPISDYWTDENFDIIWHYRKWLNIR